MTAPIPADRLAELRRMLADEVWELPAKQDVAALIGEIDRLTAENRLFHAIYDHDHPRPATCPRHAPHRAHRWLPPRSAIDCAGWPPAVEHRDGPQGSAEPSAGASVMDFPAEAPNEAQRPAGGFGAYRCPTLCDDDCEARCHEGHEVSYKQRHDVAECQARSAGAEAYRRVLRSANRLAAPDVPPELIDDMIADAQREIAPEYEYGFENMDRGGEGSMMVGRPEAEIRAQMDRKRVDFPEVRYALRRRPVGPWETIEDDFPMPLRGTGRFPHHPACANHPDRVGIFATVFGALCRECQEITPEDEGIATADVGPAAIEDAEKAAALEAHCEANSAKESTND